MSVLITVLFALAGALASGFAMGTWFERKRNQNDR
jgi:hypothetical protein